MSTKTLTVTTRDDFRKAVNDYAAQGYHTLHQGPTHITLSRKKPFNWVLAIICLFIPIIGWIALGYMLYAANRGSQVVEISLEPNAASQLPAA